MVRNPSLMQEMMRTHDRALSNLEVCCFRLQVQMITKVSLSISWEILCVNAAFFKKQNRLIFILEICTILLLSDELDYPNGVQTWHALLPNIWSLTAVKPTVMLQIVKPLAPFVQMFLRQIFPEFKKNFSCRNRKVRLSRITLWSFTA